MEDLDDKDQQKHDQNLEKTCIFFRKRGNIKHIRKKTFEEEEEESESSIVPNSTKKCFRSDNKLFFSTDDSKKSVSSSSEPKDEVRSSIFQFESSKDIQIQNDSRATAVLETETEFNKDARAIRERVLKQAESTLKDKGKGGNLSDEKLYKGIHGYTDFKAGFRREHTVASEKAGGAHGPLRASAHIRMSARFDYQPDVCKDYKETGYCGYGDACKFMHDRGDYKSGWQLEKEWEEVEKSRRSSTFGRGGKVDMVSGDESDDDGDELPFACLICREPFVDPVVTKCKHYFCEHCALKHHSRNKKCYVCNQPTLGIFNTAHEINKKVASLGKK